jgi:hypothetical protein
MSETQLADFDRKAFRFEHSLAGHEALTLESLREIVLSLPRELVSANRADIQIDADFNRAYIDHAIEHTLEDTLADMATTNSYVMVRTPETHPRLKPILEVLQAEFKEYIGKLNGASGQSVRLDEPMLYLFISSPNSMTPFHLDRYSTLLLQVQGEKDVMIWDRADRRTVSEQELEELFGQPWVAQVPYKSGRMSEPEVVHIKEGEAVHIPFTAPHAVKNSNSVSVSLSFICKTPDALRDADAYRFNYHARRLVSRIPKPISAPPPKAVGEWLLRDSAKARLMQSALRVRRAFR